jgi:hypothetical protein
MQIIALTFASSVFHREVDDNCAFLAYYAASSGAFLPTLRYNLLVPISKVRNFLEQMGPIGCPLTPAKVITPCCVITERMQFSVHFV